MSDAVITKKKSLFDLAREKFGELTPAEEVVCKRTEAGEVANMNPDGSRLTLKDASPWGESCKIRSTFIEWICSDSMARSNITRYGVKIIWSNVIGVCNLSNTIIDFPLIVAKSIFKNDIFFENSSILELGLSGSRTLSINLCSACVKKSIFMNNGFSARGVVTLLDANVGGSLEFGGGIFINKGKRAIRAGRIIVCGSVFFNNGFKAVGEVDLIHADIGNGFECSGGVFINNKSFAITADGANIKGGVFFNRKFLSLGEVRLIGTEISGQLICTDGRFINRHGISLGADNVVIGGSCFMAGNFKSYGEARFLGAKINGNVECSGSFVNNNSSALCFESSIIGCSVFINDGFYTDGEINFISSVVEKNFILINITMSRNFVLKLSSSKIGSLCDEVKSWPLAGNVVLHGLVYDNISSSCNVTLVERLDWLSRQMELHGKEENAVVKEFSTQAHEQLANVYLKNGHYNHARKVLLDKNERMKKWKLKIRSCGRNADGAGEWIYDLFHDFLGATVGYGYAPHRALLWVGVFIFLGALVFTAAFAFDLMTPAQQWPFEPDNPSWKETYPGFNPLLYSIEAFLPVVDLGVEKYWTPNTQAGSPIHIVGDYIFSIGGMVRLYLWLHIIAGWTLITLFLGSISGFIRR